MQYQTKLFNVMSRYGTGSVGNPITNVLLCHTACIDNEVNNALTYVLDMLTKRKLNIVKESNNYKLQFNDDELMVELKDLSKESKFCECGFGLGTYVEAAVEHCFGYTSVIASGEVVTILPDYMLEG